MWHSLPHDQRCNYVGYQWFCRRNFSRSYRADQPAYIASHFLEFRSAWGTKLDLDSAQLEEAKETFPPRNALAEKSVSVSRIVTTYLAKLWQRCSILGNSALRRNIVVENSDTVTITRLADCTKNAGNLRQHPAIFGCALLELNHPPYF